MRILEFEVQNYKSFDKGAHARLSSSFNIFTGQNNGGKSAFIEALASRDWRDLPHRSMQVQAPNKDSHSTVKASLIVSGREFIDGFARHGLDVCVPAINEQNDFRQSFDLFSSSIEINVTATRDINGWQINNIKVDDFIFQNSHFIILILSDKIAYKGWASGFGTLNACLSNLIAESCYFFNAERLAIGARPQNAETVLLPRAENLADVLHSFQTSSRNRYDQFLADVRLVLPNIYLITTSAFMASLVPPGQLASISFPHVRTRVWLDGTTEDQQSLGFDLEDCGTGVGQVVSMLLVIHSAINPKVLVIDEPNSFLHPGATRRLYQVFRRFSQHQFIISTHSSELIASAKKSSVHLVKWANGKSSVESLSVENTDHIKSLLDEIGVRLSDVFGADKIIWVEGPTECRVFSDILEHKGVDFEASVRFVPVVSTSEIAKNTSKAKTIVDIYDTLSRSNAIIPPAVLTFHDDQVRALEERLGGKVRFLERRCIENYALSEDAVAATLGKLEEADFATMLQKVKTWLGVNASDKKYKSPQNWQGDIADIAWLKVVDGARLLSDLFSDVTEARHEYVKVIHTPMIINNILSQDEKSIEELVEYVLALYEPAKGRPSTVSEDVITRPSSKPQ